MDDAVEKGATVVMGGNRYRHSEYPQGQFYYPTLIINVTRNMRISQEEIFGPVLIVMKFTTEEEAIELANSSPFGLGAGVFSLDYNRAENVARKLKVGFVNMNDFGVNYLCQVPTFYFFIEYSLGFAFWRCREFRN